MKRLIVLTMASNIEYLTVYNAHTGQALRIPKPVRFHALDDFKTYLFEHFTNYVAASIDNIFLLTAFGIKLNFASIDSVLDVYMYDKRLFVPGDVDAIFAKYLALTESYEVLRPKRYEPGVTVDDSDSKITSSLRVCDGWTKALVQNSHQINERIDHYIKQTSAIFLALSLVFEFTTNYIREIKRYYENHHNHVRLLSMKSLNESWRTHYNNLLKFPEFLLRALPKRIHISDFLDQNELATSAAFVAKFLPAVIDKFNTFAKEVDRVNQNQLAIDQTIENLRKDSISRFKDHESSKVAYIAEVERLSSEIVGESEREDLKLVFTRQMDRGARLYSEVEQRYKLLSSLYDFKRKLGRECVLIFEKMGSLQKTVVQVRNDIKNLISDRPVAGDFRNYGSIHGALDDLTIARIQVAEEHLSMTIDMPVLFGLMMIEKRRQYEWHNFFSKGVVHNTSEQLTMIVKHERDFQRLWIRKYGRLVKFISADDGYRIQLPSIDISVVNGKDEGRPDSILAAIGDTKIEREDITRYIQLVRAQKLESHVGDTLASNYESLSVSTENLKEITKIVATLSSFASPNNQKLLMQNTGDSVENDADLNVISGLRQRIRCLESLLHQRQYQELLNWPVLRGGANTPDNRQSMILAPSSEYKAKSRRSSRSQMEGSKILDASVTIDKHLDNIRLRRENSDLVSSKGLLLRENEKLQEQLAALRRQLEEKNTENQELKTYYEDKFTNQENTIRDLEMRHSEQEQQLKNTHEEELLKANDENSALRKELEQLQESRLAKDRERSRVLELGLEITNLNAALSDLKIANSELSSDIEQKDAQLSTERKNFETRTTELLAQLDVKTSQHQSALKAMLDKQYALNSMLRQQNQIVSKLMGDIQELIGQNMEFFKEFCFVLESMGLLLVCEKNDDKIELKITRVKGLRTKKAEVLDEKSLKGRSTPQSEYYEEFCELVLWIKELSINELETADMSSNEQEKHNLAVAEQQLKLFERYFDDSNSKFHLFMRAISFTGNVQLQTQYSDIEVVNEKFFLNGIFKRFLDVEGFARKLTKENKQKAHELARAIELGKSKITVKNFALGDLVLFLPVLMEQSEHQDTRPWTAFNIDSPHYLLDPESYGANAGKEWIVSRVKGITEHQVTEETLNDSTNNPFALGLGCLWYVIST